MPAPVKKNRMRISASEAQDYLAKRAGGGHLHEKDGKLSVVKATTEKKGYDAEKRTARFVMTTEQEDRYGDVVRTAGIDTSNFLKNPVALMGHSHRVSVGNWDNLTKVLSGRPKRMEGDLILLPGGGPVKEVEETAWLIENDGLRACSIGFMPNWDEIDIIRDEDGHWLGLDFLESELIECSPCIIPANPAALMKHADGSPAIAKELLEKVLDEWAKDPITGLVMPRADFEKAYTTTVEETGGKKSFFFIENGGTSTDDPAEEPKKPEDNPDVPEEVITSDETSDKDDEKDKPETAPEGTVTSDDVPKDKTAAGVDITEDGITIKMADGSVVKFGGATPFEVNDGILTLNVGALKVDSILGDPQPEKIEELLDGLDQTKKLDGFMGVIKQKFMEFFSKAPEPEDEPDTIDPVAIDFAKARAAATIAQSKYLH